MQIQKTILEVRCSTCQIEKRMKIAIIGAGVAGLALAVRLASAGHEVEVFEANDQPGGKLSEFSQDGYRFDAGPSLFTMPHYVEELFALAGEDMAPSFRYEKLSVLCQYFWDDGTRLTAHTDAHAFAREAAQILGVPAARILGALHDSEQKYRLTGRIFLEQSLHKVSTWLQADVLRALLQLPRYDLFTTMNAVNEQRLKHPKLVQLFNRFATYNGSNPYRTPGLLTIIPHFEHGIGAFYPQGGMYSIARALWQLAERRGARFHFRTPVSGIEIQKGRTTGIRIGSEVLPFNAVASNMDVWFTYHKLMPDQPAPERILRQEKSTSALIFYWGISRHFAELDLHNIFFSRDYRYEFDCLAKGTISDDPTIYVNISSKYTPADAPPGCENWFTMVNAPCHTGQDWDALIGQTRQHLLAKLSHVLKTPIEPLIACERVLDPRGIENRTASHLGALYGTSSNNRMAAFLRHPNFSRRIRGLYFCGGSVHPGGGIPLALLSAKIAAQQIQEDLLTLK